MEKPYGIIYKAEFNHPDGMIKIYIGQTIGSLRERKNNHKTGAYLNIKKDYFHNAIKKYGFDNWKWNIICACKNKDELDKKEIEWINHYQERLFYNCLNLKSGGANGKPSNEVREKIRASMIISMGRYKGIPLTKETKAKLSESLKNYYKEYPEARQRVSDFNKAIGNKPPCRKGIKCRPLSIEHKIKLRESMKIYYEIHPEELKKLKECRIGIKCSKETCDKMSKSRIGFKASESHKLAMSRSMIGKNLGKIRSKESKIKMSESRKKYYKNHPECLKNLSENLKGKSWIISESGKRKWIDKIA